MSSSASAKRASTGLTNSDNSADGPLCGFKQPKTTENPLPTGLTGTDAVVTQLHSFQTERVYHLTKKIALFGRNDSSSDKTIVVVPHTKHQEDVVCDTLKSLQSSDVFIHNDRYLCASVKPRAAGRL
jgi:hypothetical protein